MKTKLLESGDRAPDFALPAVHRDGMVTLEEYRGRSPVLVGFFRGLNCPFCRRLIAQLGALVPDLRATGVECLGIVCTPVKQARLYARYYPPKLPLASDVEGVTHHAFGIPRFAVLRDDAAETPRWPWSVKEGELRETRVNPQGIFPAPLPVDEAADELNRRDGFQATPEDKAVSARHWNQVGALFLIDRDGIVRWRDLEAADGPAGVGSFPSTGELLRVAASVAAAPVTTADQQRA
jgi:peroxiredoxin